jgi:hypothetical protein
MGKKKFTVTIDEVIISTYWVEVEAESAEEAEEKAMLREFLECAKYGTGPAEYEVVEVCELKEE